MSSTLESHELVVHRHAEVWESSCRQGVELKPTAEIGSGGMPELILWADDMETLLPCACMATAVKEARRLTLMLDTYAGRTLDADDFRPGQPLGPLFEAGDPRVVEALMLIVVDDTDPISPQVFSLGYDRGLPRGSPPRTPTPDFTWIEDRRRAPSHAAVTSAQVVDIIRKLAFERPTDFDIDWTMAAGMVAKLAPGDLVIAVTGT